MDSPELTKAKALLYFFTQENYKLDQKILHLGEENNKLIQRIQNQESYIKQDNLGNEAVIWSRCSNCQVLWPEGVTTDAMYGHYCEGTDCDKTFCSFCLSSFNLGCYCSCGFLFICNECSSSC